jgi:hypothetical protein
MANTAFGLTNMLGFTPLTESIQTIANGLPRLFPDSFYTTTERVFADTGKNFAGQGTRKVSPLVPYGAPPLQVQMAPVQGQQFKLLHTIRELVGDQAFLQLVLAMEANPAFTIPREGVLDQLNYQATLFATEFQNLRTAVIGSMLGNGKLWFDVSGFLLPTSSGADLTIDYAFPTATAAISWGTTTTNILQEFTNITLARYFATGYPITTAYYGKNVASYMLNNANLNPYFARNSRFREELDATGTIPNGVFGINWVPAYRTFFDDQSGTVQEQFPADQITFLPDVNRATYAMYEGSYLIPTSYQPMADFAAAAASVKMVYGMGRYAEFLRNPRLAFKDTMFDTFLPRFKVPNAVLIFDTTP